MYRNNKIGVSIPCYNEEKFIPRVIKNMPPFVDKMYVVDDASTDETWKIINDLAKKDKRIIPLQNSKNHGNGYSVVKGYKAALQDNCHTVCLMAGDDQCLPEYLKKLVSGVVDDNFDYVKANRFHHKEELKQMPRFRYHSNILMSLLSKFASGYYSIVDPLNSYSALSATTLNKINLDQISHRYEFENSLLFHLYMIDAAIKDVPVPAKYAGEQSDINLLTYIPRTSLTMLKSFYRRITAKYMFSSFHPIALFYISGLTLLLFGLIWGLYIAIQSIGPATASTSTVMLSIVPFILGFQLLLQAIVLDIQNEPKQ